MSPALRPLAPHDLGAARALLAAVAPGQGLDRVAAEKLFGGDPPGREGRAEGAFAGGELVGLVAWAGRWLKLLAVAGGARRRGLGTRLLQRFLEATAGQERPRRALDHPGNYWTPGVDAADPGALAFFAARGFREVGRAVNLAVPLVGVDAAQRAARAAERAAQGGYALRRALAADGPALARLCEGPFGSAAWAFEVARALRADPPAVHLAEAGAELVAFGAHDGNNQGLGWFGPAGTLDAHRGRGLGEALLWACLADVAARGLAEGGIAWAGPVDFYRRTAGARVARELIQLERR